MPRGRSEHVVEISDTESEKTLQVVRELWGPGGPLAELVSKSSEHVEWTADDPHGLVNEWYESAVAAAVIAFAPPAECTKMAAEARYETPPNLHECFTSAHDEDAWRFGQIKKRKLWADSFVLQCDESVWSATECEPLVRLLRELHRWRTDVPEWLRALRPMRSYQHGDLNAANVLIDLRGSLWLIDFASTGPEKNPFNDAAKMVAAVLFEYFPIPLSVQEVRTASAQKLKDAFSLPSDDLAYALCAKWRACDNAAEMVAAAEELGADDEVVKRVRRVCDEATSLKRMEEGYELVDTLFAPADGGRLPELWQIGQRKPKESWAMHMQLTFSLCTGIVRIVTQLVGNVSQKAEAAARHSDRADTRPADLHVVHFMMPLLVRALCCVRYSGLSVHQMRVAWYAARKLCAGISDAMPRLPTPPPSLDAKPSKQLKLAAGLPLLVLTDKEARLSGGMGSMRLAVTHHDDSRSAPPDVNGADDADDAEGSKAIWLNGSVEPIAVDFDGMSQSVLPFLVSLPEATEAIDEARMVAQALHELQTLRDTAPRLTDGNPNHSDALADQLVSVIETLGEVSTTLRGEAKEARKAIAAAKRVNANDRRSLENSNLVADAFVKESIRHETSYLNTLVKATALDPAPLEAVEEDCIERLKMVGAAGLRLYACGQELNVLLDGAWYDVTVVKEAKAAGAPTRLRPIDGGSIGEFDLVLHPFNHGPRDVSSTNFAAVQRRHDRALRNAHSGIVDALSGRRLNVFDQCVPIEIGATGTSAEVSPLQGVTDVAGLAAWLQSTHTQRSRGQSVTACVLLTAGPAAGKTCLMSQLVMHTLEAQQGHGLVPVLIKIQNLQKKLLSPDNRERFARCWNWADAYLQSVYGADSEHYRMLRQAMFARRTLLLLDGLDEGGQVRAQIEKHVTEVLAPQGHVMLVTSRPAGVSEDLFSRHFHRIVLKPLSEDQQREVIQQRIDPEHVDDLMLYVDERVPRDTETGIRVTGNPLMLSMVVSIYETRVVQVSKYMGSRDTTQMPKTIAELYQVRALASTSPAPPSSLTLSVRFSHHLCPCAQLSVTGRKLDNAPESRPQGARGCRVVRRSTAPPSTPRGDLLPSTLGTASCHRRRAARGRRARSARPGQARRPPLAELQRRGDGWPLCASAHWRAHGAVCDRYARQPA